MIFTMYKFELEQFCKEKKDACVNLRKFKVHKSQKGVCKLQIRKVSHSDSIENGSLLAGGLADPILKLPVQSNRYRFNQES
jgi:hypothetical protein